jgi:coenzyme F420-reducing hydrogenase gamma subunit
MIKDMAAIAHISIAWGYCAAPGAAEGAAESQIDLDLDDGR